MRLIILTSLLLFVLSARAQTNIALDTTSRNSELTMDNDTRAILLLLDSNPKIDKSKLINSIKGKANYYIPPVLYDMSIVLFNMKRFKEGCFWFYVAQLRSKFDINRCTDTTVSASDWDQPIGLVINQYASSHIDTLKEVIPKVIEFVKSNEERYDQRWINITSHNLKKDQNQDLSVDKKKWPAIKQRTIDLYYSEFKEALSALKK